jgi:hypothetical protein
MYPGINQDMTLCTRYNPFWVVWLQNLKNVYTPQEFLTIDEAICAFQGRIHFRVYMKGKPNKYGTKIF